MLPCFLAIEETILGELCQGNVHALQLPYESPKPVAACRQRTYTALD